MDLKAFVADGPPPAIETFLTEGSRKPIVAAIEGFALAGGLEIALTCDLIVASDDAILGLPAVTVGLVAAGGALHRLPKRVPLGPALELLLTGAPIDARRAHELGLLNRVTARGHALIAASDLAARIARNAPLATALSKELARDGQALSERELWERQPSRVASLFGSNDAREGALAFAQKRPPRWTAR